MRRKLLFSLGLIILLAILAGCGSAVPNSVVPKQPKAVKITKKVKEEMNFFGTNYFLYYFILANGQQVAVSEGLYDRATTTDGYSTAQSDETDPLVTNPDEIANPDNSDSITNDNGNSDSLSNDNGDSGGDSGGGANDSGGAVDAGGD